ncbi:MAG: hypothetical protein EB120_05130 [Proteobacteria bacterium]|nr:hypothetical protein [Pseudomonadota bacterium]
MGSIKHSKYKNTGILFELCVRQITSDLLNNRDSKAVKIFKKYFTNTELGNEYALYATIVKSPKLNETKSEILLSTVLEQHKKLDRSKINKQKYNLIKEIKSNYDIDDFFKAKISNYRTHAAIYTIFESNSEGYMNNTEQIVENKIVLMEHLLGNSKSTKKEDSMVEGLVKEDRDIRLLTYKILIKKFNEKYSDFSDRQKKVLKEYIYNITDTVKLKEFLNEEMSYIKKELSSIQKDTKDKVIKIKIGEVIKFVNPIRENESVKDELITGILQYHQLINELKSK